VTDRTLRRDRSGTFRPRTTAELLRPLPRRRNECVATNTFGARTVALSRTWCDAGHLPCRPSSLTCALQVEQDAE